MKHQLPHVTRRRFLSGTAAAAALVSTPTLAEDFRSAANHFSDEPGQYILHFGQPASKWPNALPVGNGRLGAMVFGVPGLDRLQLNEESIWDGEPNRDRNNPKAAAAVPRIRDLLFAGRITEAEQLAVSDMLSIPRRMPCYQTLGDLHMDFSGMGLTPDVAVDDYRLELDLDKAIASTTFSHNGVKYQREIFVSAPDQVIVVRLTADQPNSLCIRLSLDRPGSFKASRVGNDRLSLDGQALPVNDNPGLPVKEHQTGVRFHATLLAVPQGGSILPPKNQDDTTLEISAASTITLFIDCATSYRYPAPSGKISGVDAAVLEGDPAAMRAAVERNLTAASRQPYDLLRARHIQDHQRYFRRADISFGPDPNAAVPTDKRMEAVKAGGEDLHLLPIYFQFGRYLLVSSSRPGTLAANLQGIWNESVDPPWGSKYTVNINLEMNYWFADSANLEECQLPLFDLLAATRKPGELTAREIYRAGGSVVHHNTDIWGDSGPIDGLGGGIWSMGANWISLHLWRHYEWTGDRRFLADHAYPALREHALFLVDYLVRDPNNGYLVTGPSCSPENSYELPNGEHHNLCMGPTMGISITRSVFWRLLEAADLLQRWDPKNSVSAADKDLLDRVRSDMAQLPPFKIGPDGRLQEWLQGYADHEPGHRHISHLFGLFPEDQMTVQGTPELAHACRLVLEKRLANGGGSTGWSRAWIINCFARLGDGEACYANILALLRHSTRPNLLDVCGLKENSPFQIDGNLGGPNGLIEMLLQSHGETPLTVPTDTSQYMRGPGSPIIRLLPAVPAAWHTGSFRGLRARGGVEIDMEWSDGKAIKAELRATSSGPHRVLPPPGQQIARIVIGKRTVKPPIAINGITHIEFSSVQSCQIFFA